MLRHRSCEQDAWKELDWLDIHLHGLADCEGMRSVPGLRFGLCSGRGCLAVGRRALCNQPLFLLLSFLLG
jgi:hypothetical protein